MKWINSFKNGFKVVGAMVSGVALMVTTPLTALAQPSDGGQAYLDTLYATLQEHNGDAYQIASQAFSDDYHVQLAGLFCQGFDAGYTPDELLTTYLEGVYSSPEVNNIPQNYLEAVAYYAGVAMSTSAYQYCPEHWSMLQEWVDSQ